MKMDLGQSPIGEIVRTEAGASAYVPTPLPNVVDFDLHLATLVDRASRAVATLAGIGETLANPRLLIQPFLRREAVLSSRIEGTQASLADVYAFEAAGRSGAGDVREVANYIRALELGQTLLTELPISVRLLRETHRALLDGVRGHDRRPGEFRTTQVWIGTEGTPIEDARFVPPPPDSVPDLLADWERFVNADLDMPPLVQCALMHYQFEAIHPFLDGNGRIGRLAIILFLMERAVLPTPLLYLSAFFERHRQEYYDHLLRVSATGEWGPWLEFFAQGVAEQARDAIERSRALRELHEAHRQTLQAARESGNAFQLLEELFVRPIVSRPGVAALLNVSSAGARGIIERLERASILSPVPDTYPQLFEAHSILDALEGRR